MEGPFMPDRHETTGNTSPDASGTFLRPEERIDRDRIASMADEGGLSGAVADLREQLDYPPHVHIKEAPLPAASAARPLPRSRWRTIVWSALALGAAGFLAGLALRYRTRRI